MSDEKKMADDEVTVATRPLDRMRDRSLPVAERLLAAIDQATVHGGIGFYGGSTVMRDYLRRLVAEIEQDMFAPKAQGAYSQPMFDAATVNECSERGNTKDQDVPSISSAESLESKLAQFEGELSGLINKYSLENLSDTPDFQLANFMLKALTAFSDAVNWRNNWHAPTESTFHSGDVVRLKSGGPKMTVLTSEGNGAMVAWFAARADDSAVYRDSFDASMLEKVDA